MPASSCGSTKVRSNRSMRVSRLPGWRVYWRSSRIGLGSRTVADSMRVSPWERACAGIVANACHIRAGSCDRGDARAVRRRGVMLAPHADAFGPARAQRGRRRAAGRWHAAPALPRGAPAVSEGDHPGAVAPERVLLAQRDAAGGWRTITYGQALERARRIAAGLVARGLSAERPVVV